MCRIRETSVVQFVDRISSSFDYDYEEFRDSASASLRQLRAALEPLQSKNVENKIQEMLTYVVHEPNWDMESTRDRVLSDASVLAEYLNKKRSATSTI